jgi:hypothetical protein
MDSKLTYIIWTHVVNRIVHIKKRVMLRKNNEKTQYKLWKGTPTNLNHFRVFGIKCYIKTKYGIMGGRELKEEKNESMEQLYKEEEEDEEEVEGKDEEDHIEVEEKVQQLPPNTPRK